MPNLCCDKCIELTYQQVPRLSIECLGYVLAFHLTWRRAIETPLNLSFCAVIADSKIEVTARQKKRICAVSQTQVSVVTNVTSMHSQPSNLSNIPKNLVESLKGYDAPSNQEQGLNSLILLAEWSEIAITQPNHWKVTTRHPIKSKGWIPWSYWRSEVRSRSPTPEVFSCASPPLVFTQKASCGTSAWKLTLNTWGVTVSPLTRYLFLIKMCVHCI